MQRTTLIGWAALVLLGAGLMLAIFLGEPTAVAQDGADDHMMQMDEMESADLPALPLVEPDISLDQAHLVLEAAVAEAKNISTKMDIAVVDAGGNLKAFVRMDGAWLGSIDIAIKKAKTARYFDMPTGNIGELSQPGGPLYGIEHSNDGLITFPGGVPVRDEDGTIIGAIGVSGSTVENDHTVAAAGAEAINP